MKTTKRRMRYNYKRFVEHVSEWDDNLIPYGWRQLIQLSRRYKTPVPKEFRHLLNQQ